MTAPTDPAVPVDQITADALAVIAYIEQHGGGQALYQGPTGQVCLDGAMHAVKFGHPKGSTKNVTHKESVEYWQLRNAIRAHIGHQITFWNDDPDRTKEDVLTMLREFVATRFVATGRAAGGDA